MASLTSQDKAIIEKLLGMQAGYVLDLSNRTFQGLILEVAGVDIYDAKYSFQGDSKANRLRAFWKSESDYVNGVVLQALIDRLDTSHVLAGTPPEEAEARLAQECSKIADRLKRAVLEEDLAAIRAAGPQREFDVLASAIRDAVAKNEPETALDRLHTYLVKYLRSKCQSRKVALGKDRPLHSLLGEYLKALSAGGVTLTTMAERILKSSVSVVEAFNEIRNGRSLAHDNPLLGSKEAMFIFKAIANLVQLLDDVDPA